MRLFPRWRVHFCQPLRESIQGRALVAVSLSPPNLCPEQKCQINSTGGRAPWSVCLSSQHLLSLEGTYISVWDRSFFLMEVNTLQIPGMWPFQGIPRVSPSLDPPPKLIFYFSFLACFSRQPRGTCSRGLRMTVITEQGSSKRLISPILATKLINVI